jgi:hypothetical protein
MIDKPWHRCPLPLPTVFCATVAIGGSARHAFELIDALIAQGARELTIVTNNGQRRGRPLCSRPSGTQDHLLVSVADRFVCSMRYSTPARSSRAGAAGQPGRAHTRRWRRHRRFYTPTAYGIARRQATVAAMCSNIRSPPILR